MTERAGVLSRLRSEREVRVVTSAADGREHRTIVWIVVDPEDRILVRSYRGAGARWYREATSGRPVAVELDGADVPVTVEWAGSDSERVSSCSRELATKYASHPATPAMVADDVLDTTLELATAF